jgi:hypothetical protein
MSETQQKILVAFFGTGRQEIVDKEVISFLSLSQEEEGLAIGVSQAL